MWGADGLARRGNHKFEKLKQVSSWNKCQVDANRVSNPHNRTGKCRSTGEVRVQKGKSSGTSKKNQVRKELEEA